MPDPALVLVTALFIFLLTVGILFARSGGTARRVSASPLSTPTLGRQFASAATKSVRPAQNTPFPLLESTSTLETAGIHESDIEPSQTPTGWEALPVVPPLTPGALKIYQQGLKLGNNPRAFSKVGACESAATWFLEDFDKESGYYSLGQYAYLQPVISYFTGSFGRTSLAARDGARISTLLSPFWSDQAVCDVDETPLDCEYRVFKPAFAIISIGTNDIEEREKFETELRQVIDITIKHGIVPILSTKADNVEGDNSNNATIAKLAAVYDLPLWNFWAAVQSLPGGGLDYDGAHLNWGNNYFDQPYALRTGWAMRNLTALQVLESMMKGVQQAQSK
jgi:hypothetical protein